MNTMLWIVQGILAFAFAMAGGMKSTQPGDFLVKTMVRPGRFSLSTVRLIGIVELLGAIGLMSVFVAYGRFNML